MFLPEAHSKKQVNDLMIELGSDVVKLNENFNVLSKVLKLLENYAKTESHTTSIVHEITVLD